jgi:hypothetical protein
MMPGMPSQSTAEIISENRKLLFQGSFHHRLFQHLDGGSIRDDLTNLSLTNMRETEDADIHPDVPRKTHAERLAAIMSAKRDQYLAQGWAAMKAGNYLRANDQFGNAMCLDQEDAEAHAGRVIAALSGRRLEAARAYLKTFANHCKNPFIFRRNLEDTLPSQEFGKTMVDYISELAEGNTSDPDLAALNVYLLWMDGRDSAAQSAAEALHQQFRTSEFAGFVDEIRDAKDAKTTDLKEEPLAALRG